MNALDILRGLSRNDAFANGRLLAACAGLGPGEYEATRVSFFPSLVETLEHLYLVHAYYFDALVEGDRARGGEEGVVEGGRGREVLADVSALATFAELKKAQQALDLRTVSWVATLGEADLAREVRIARRTGTDVETIGDVLLHLYEHQIHHRGQVHAMLAGSSVAPPPLDEYFLRADQPQAEGELAALGHAPLSRSASGP